MEQELKKIIGHVFEIDLNKINNQFGQDNCNFWDSITHLSLVVEIEKKFNISFTPEEIGEMTHYQSIFNVVESHLSGE